ncbi:MAG: oxygen-independent coproporphyrinogen III oxidase [Myxococcaceae bacterium]
MRSGARIPCVPKSGRRKSCSRRASRSASASWYQRGQVSKFAESLTEADWAVPVRRLQLRWTEDALHVIPLRSESRCRSLLESYGSELVPRYTSYPPANRWDESLSDADARKAIPRSNRPLSLYVHVPFCRKLCFYCGCNMLVTRNAALVEQYLRALEMEVERLASLLPRTPEVVQLHLGGGTPTYLEPEQLTRLVLMLREHFAWKPQVEASIEVHPAVTTVEQMRVLAGLGFNRVSMGVQDFDPVVQSRVNRIQQWEQTRDLVQASRDLGFVSINVDLMYGLPRQTVHGFMRTLDRIEELRPERVALFGYAHVPSLKRRQGQFTPEELPSSELRLALFEKSLARLQDAGYQYIGLDHFALPTDELSQARANGTLRRNFMGYTTCAETDVLAFGPSAISDIGGAYLQNEREVHRWAKRLEDGGLAVSRGHWLSFEEGARRDILAQLFCQLEVDFDEVARRYPGVFDDEFQQEWSALERLERDGLVQRAGENRFRVSLEGQLLLRSVAAALDPYFRARNPVRLHAPAL